MADVVRAEHPSVLVVKVLLEEESGGEESTEEDGIIKGAPLRVGGRRGTIRLALMRQRQPQACGIETVARLPAGTSGGAKAQNRKAKRTWLETVSSPCPGARSVTARMKRAWSSLWALRVRVYGNRGASAQ